MEKRMDAGDIGEIEEQPRKRSKDVGWSDLQPELLALIFRRMDVVDYTRALSVCASWRSLPERSMNFCKPMNDHQLPWLLIPSLNDDPCSRSFYIPSRCFHTKMAKHTMHLPQIAHHSCIGSSQGFLITVDSSANFRALNPLTGACFTLPRTPARTGVVLYDDHHPSSPHRRTIPDGDYTDVFPAFHKAVISPSLDTIAVVSQGIAYTRKKGGYFINVAFARVGDDSWTALEQPWTLRWSPYDLIFHNGLIYVLFCNGYLVAFDPENPAAPPLVSPRMRGVVRPFYAFLTETPDRHDLLLLVINKFDQHGGI